MPPVHPIFMPASFLSQALTTFEKGSAGALLADYKAWEMFCAQQRLSLALTMTSICRGVYGRISAGIPFAIAFSLGVKSL
jgi:hypothetical protein